MPGDSICHPTIAEVVRTSWVGFLLVFAIGMLIGVRIGSEIQARIYRRLGGRDA